LGTISGPTYRERTVPVVAQYLADLGGLIGELGELLFIQDEAPGHTAKETKELLKNFAIHIIPWPPYPDLNPIETLWKHIKEYLTAKYGLLLQAYCGSGARDLISLITATFCI
jgi:transposase